MITRFEPPTVIVQGPDDLRWSLNEYEWYNLRAEIKRTKATGWFWVESNEVLHEISKTGTVAQHPPQFNLMGDLLYKLVFPKKTV